MAVEVETVTCTIAPAARPDIIQDTGSGKAGALQTSIGIACRSVVDAGRPDRRGVARVTGRHAVNHAAFGAVILEFGHHEGLAAFAVDLRRDGQGHVPEAHHPQFIHYGFSALLDAAATVVHIVLPPSMICIG